LKAAGQLTSGVGGLYSNVAHLAGEDGKMGGYLQMIGAGMGMAGSATNFINDLKLKGIDVSNPLTVAGELVQKNIDNLKAGVADFKTEMANNTKLIGAGFKDMFGPDIKVEGGDFLAKQTAGLIDKGTGKFSQDKVGEKVTYTNLAKMEIIVDKLETRMKTQYFLAGAKDEKINELTGQFTDVKKAIDVLEKMKGGTLVQTPENMAQIQGILEKGNVAIAGLNADFDHKFGSEKTGVRDELGLAQVRGGMYDNSTWQNAKDLLSNNQKYTDAQKIEQEANKGSVIGVLRSHLEGAARTEDAYLQQIKRADDLDKALEQKGDRPETRAQADKELYDRAKNVSEIADGISESGPLGADPNGQLQKSVIAASTALRGAAELESASSEDREIFQKQADKLDRIAGSYLSGIDLSLAASRLSDEMPETKAEAETDLYLRAKNVSLLTDRVSEFSPLKTDNFSLLQTGAEAASGVLRRAAKLENATPQEREKFEIQAGKLDRIASGQVQTETPSETLKNLKREVFAREKAFQNETDKWEKRRKAQAQGDELDPEDQIDPELLEDYPLSASGQNYSPR